MCAGRFCSNHTNADPRANARREFDARRGSAFSRGYSSRGRWSKLRKLVIARDPICQIGKKCNHLAPSAIADHIFPKSAGGDDSMENLQGACKACHDWKTAMEDSNFVRSK